MAADEMTTPYVVAEAGQGLILAVMAMTVVFVIGALVVDLGLWLSERNGAQADADFVALAGAWELMSFDPADPYTPASKSLAANDEQGNATANVDANQTCFNTGETDAVEADVQHDTFSVFSAFYGVFAPEVGAHAKACAGATNAPRGIVPFEIFNTDPACFEPNGTPNFSVLCPLDYGTPGNPDPREILDLDLQRPSDHCGDAFGGNEVDVIMSSAAGKCLMSEGGGCAAGGPWYDCVHVENVNTNSVMKAVRERLAAGQPCDVDADGVDSLDESVIEVFTDIFQAKDCDSPRLVSVIVLDQDPSAGNAYPIEAFAGFYIAGCGEDTSGPVDPDCDPSSGPPYNVVYGQFVNLIMENSGVGAPRDSTTLFSVALVE